MTTDFLNWSPLCFWSQFDGCFCSGPVIWYAIPHWFGLLFLSASFIDGEIVLSKNKSIFVPLCFQTCLNKWSARPAKVDRGWYNKWKKNISIMVTPTFAGVFDATLFSSSRNNLDFGVFCIVPSTWLFDNGTGVSGYLSIGSISTSACKAW